MDLWILIYPYARGPKWLMPALSCVCFTSLYVGDALSDGLSLTTRWYVFGVAGVLVEAINQISHVIAKRDTEMGVLVKCCLFWPVFLGAVIVYVLVARSGHTSPTAGVPGGATTIVYLILSWVLPNYSMSPEYRFLLLRGRFRSE